MLVGTTFHLYESRQKLHSNVIEKPMLKENCLFFMQVCLRDNVRISAPNKQSS